MRDLEKESIDLLKKFFVETPGYDQELKDNKNLEPLREVLDKVRENLT